MSEQLTSLDWKTAPIGEYVTSWAVGPRFPGEWYDENGRTATLRTTDMSDDGKLTLSSMPKANLPFAAFSPHFLQKNDLVISRSGTCGVAGVFPGYEISVVPGAFLIRFRFADSIEPIYIRYLINSPAGRASVLREAEGGVQKNIRGTSVLRIPFTIPPLRQQRKIARILTTVDNLIEKTESLIAKYQAVKQGMMHDLFTRGVDAHGKLRPPQSEAPELYKESKLGWIPKAWEVGGLKEKSQPNHAFLRTGPFGSSLKSEHWVREGVPVVTIGSLGEGTFIRSELLYITNAYAKVLYSFALESGDIVFSRVADVGRSVVMTESENGWIMSSNLMRIRLDSALANPYFIYLSIVFSASVKKHIRQSVNAGGRDVANSKVMGGLQFALPPLDEQKQISKIAQRHDSAVSLESQLLEKLKLQKTGLMQDLLTGKVRVKLDEIEEVATNG